MMPPSRVTPEELVAAVATWLDENAIICDERQGTYRCRHCQRILASLRVPFSLHASDFGFCSGFGQVKQFDLPWCPSCEPQPVSYAVCIHVPMDELRRFGGCTFR